MNKVAQKTSALMQGFLAVMVIFLVLVCVMLGIDLGRRIFLSSTFLNWPQFLVRRCPVDPPVVDPPPKVDGDPGRIVVDPPRPEGKKEGVVIFKIDADYAVFTYAFIDGEDLDTRTRVISPDIGQDAQSHIGWGQKNQFPFGNPIPILEWGGDNRGTGVESVKIDLREFRKQHPSEGELKIDCRAFWYGQIGTKEVNIEAVFYKGGKMIKDGFSFSNPHPETRTSLGSTSIKIEAKSQEENLPGQRIATFKYNLNTGVGQFDTTDTTSP